MQQFNKTRFNESRSRVRPCEPLVYNRVVKLRDGAPGNCALCWPKRYKNENKEEKTFRQRVQIIRDGQRQASQMSTVRQDS